jgi:hypothetical protein
MFSPLRPFEHPGSEKPRLPFESNCFITMQHLRSDASSISPLKDRSAKAFGSGFTKKQENLLRQLLLEMSKDAELTWEVSFEMFTIAHPWHPFTREEIRHGASLMATAVEVDQEPHMLPNDCPGPPTSFTAKQNERIIELTIHNEKNIICWTEFYDSLQAEFPELSEKEIRRQYLYLKVRRNYDIDCKLLMLYCKIKFSDTYRNHSPAEGKLNLYRKLSEETRKYFPDLQDSDLDLKIRLLVLEKRLDTVFSEATNAATISLCESFEAGSSWNQWEVVLEEFKKRNKGYEWFDVEDLQCKYLEAWHEAKAKANENEN